MMEDGVSEELFGIFEERMAAICSVVPSAHAKSLVSGEWFSYIDSLAPHVESIRPSQYMKSRAIMPRKTGNIPVVQLLAERINRGGFDAVVIEDPGVLSDHIPTWGPNLLLVGRDFAYKVVALGCLP
jgi:hypothetical protein